MKHQFSQILRILNEGAAQAWQQLTSNKLRSFLSLLGVTIGIFCIIGVKSSVNSLEANIRGSIAKLGSDVIYVERFSWGEDPGQNYWKWMRRPNATYTEYQLLQDRLDGAEKIGFWSFIGMKTVKWKSSSYENAFSIAMTEDCRDLFHLEFQEGGRFISPVEYHSGAEVCILGNKIAKGLFGENVDGNGRTVTIGGRKLRVIGILKEAGNDILKPFNFDGGVLVGMDLARRAFNVRKNSNTFGRTSLMVQAKEGVDIDEMKDQLTGIMRSVRRLKPTEDDNFALNTLSIVSNLFDQLFSTINVAGFIIGIFALIVGVFSVANIMFVSVKERTNIIGVKMALGAKRWFILLEILLEAVILCLVGGIIGILIIWGATELATKALDFELFLSFENLLWGLVASVIAGTIAGLIPAIQASGLDPVEAMRK